MRNLKHADCTSIIEWFDLKGFYFNSMTWLRVKNVLGHQVTSIAVQRLSRDINGGKKGSLIRTVETKINLPYWHLWRKTREARTFNGWDQVYLQITRS